jgi:hypothetical protein
MSKPLIHFTVSMWNRFDHLKKLMTNLNEVFAADHQFMLHVGFFESDDVMASDARWFVENHTSYPARLVHLQEPFVNGRGHNAVAEGIPSDEIICAVTVDLQLPLNLPDRVRRSAKQGESFYGPMVSCADRNGQQYRDEFGYALFGIYGSDFAHAGGFPENKKWGGDNDKHPEGGEDMVFVRKLRKQGIRAVRPYVPELCCRWHPREITTKFYSTLGRYHKKPWWTFMKNGEEVSHCPRS